MKGEFFVIKESFESNAANTLTDLAAKIQALHADFQLIRESEYDQLFVHANVYEMEFLPGVFLTDILYNKENTHFDKEILRALKRVLIESENAEYDSELFKEMLIPEINADTCYGVMTFQLIQGLVDDFQVVYTEESWLTFRRKFLGKYPKDPVHFMATCSYLFPGIYFHERNKVTVGIYLADSSQKLVTHLSALNDNFKSYVNSPYNRTDTLRRFSTGEGLDETASPEGDAARKRNFTFSFNNNLGQTEQICCEPHMKLPYNDNYPGDRSYNTDRRIYFHEGKANIQDGRILVGHIGDHL